MSLIYAAVLPHNPVLIPTIGKEHTNIFSATLKAIETIGNQIKILDIDTLFITSPHSPNLGNAFGINLAKEYKGNFKKFGDLATTINCKGDIELAYKSKEFLETKAQVQIYSEEDLDYGTSVPLYHVLKYKSDIRIIPLSQSDLSNREHFDFGMLLKKEAELSSKKVGIITSIHLSHRHDESNPKGYHPDGKKFDNEIKQNIKNKNDKNLINLPTELLTNADSCGFKNLITLLGAINEFNYEPHILSYEIIFGIGHLTVEFKL